MLLSAILIVAATLAGAVSGALTAWLFLRRQRQSQTGPVSADPARAAEIDRTVAAWSKAQGRPEATGLMADKLHLLYGIGQRRGWWR